MRKIEKEMFLMLRQLRGGDNLPKRGWNRQNTEITVETNYDRDSKGAKDIEVRLHGNHIATIEVDSETAFRDVLKIRDTGWQTPTTKSRLNAILNLVDYFAGIFQEKGEWFIQTAQEPTEPRLTKEWKGGNEWNVLSMKECPDSSFASLVATSEK
tara:strand:- start:2462 stop:2926 length:465 start_codon:yes stop_codon:yes gene_type:complete